MVTRGQPDGWGIKSMRFHGLNMVNCAIVTGHTWTPLVSTYLSPSTMEHLPYSEEKLQKFKGLGPIVLGVFNVNLDDSQRSRSQRMANLLTEFGLIDLV